MSWLNPKGKCKGVAAVMPLLMVENMCLHNVNIHDETAECIVKAHFRFQGS